MTYSIESRVDDHSRGKRKILKIPLLTFSRSKLKVDRRLRGVEYIEALRNIHDVEEDNYTSKKA